MTRGSGTWPSWQLVGAILGIDILASIFALFGWISGPAPHNGLVYVSKATAFSSDLLMGRRHTDIVTVVKIWAYSFGVIIIIALVFFLLNKITVRR